MKATLTALALFLATGGPLMAQPKKQPKYDGNWCIAQCNRILGPNERNGYSYCMSRCYVWIAEREKRIKR